MNKPVLLSTSESSVDFKESIVHLKIEYRMQFPEF